MVNEVSFAREAQSHSVCQCLINPVLQAEAGQGKGAVTAQLQGPLGHA